MKTKINLSYLLDDVAVDDALLVRRLERFSNLPLLKKLALRSGR